MKEVILKVEGMKCEGCERRIQNALMDIDGVDKVVASYMDKDVKIILSKDVDVNLLKEAILDLDFKVVEQVIL